jgi:hypothetical protein
VNVRSVRGHRFAPTRFDLRRPMAAPSFALLSILEDGSSRLKGASVATISNCAQVRESLIGIGDAEGEDSERGGPPPALAQCSVRVGFLPPLEPPRTLLEQRPAVPPQTRPLLSLFCSRELPAGAVRGARLKSLSCASSDGAARSGVVDAWSVVLPSAACGRSTSPMHCDLFRSERLPRPQPHPRSGEH